jgi:RNA polymerase sigma-70 factor (ECF subfamily)
VDTPDREILTRCIEGDGEAFRLLVERHQSYGYALAYRLLWNEEDARDIVQEAFVRVWQHLSRFNPEHRFTTWFYRIVTNLCYDRMRAKRRSRALARASAREVPMASDVEEAYDHRTLAARIRRLAEDLKPRQRSVFILRDLQNLSVEETARVLGISKGAVKSNLYHARRNVRKRLEEEVEEDE